MRSRGKRRGTSPPDEPQASSSTKVTDAACISTVLTSLLSENQNLNKKLHSLLRAQSKVNEKLQREIEHMKLLLPQNNTTPVSPQVILQLYNYTPSLLKTLLFVV